MNKKFKIALSSSLLVVFLIAATVVFMSPNNGKETEVLTEEKTAETSKIEYDIPPIASKPTTEQTTSGNTTNEPTIKVDDKGNQVITPNYEKPAYSNEVLTNPDVKPSDTQQETSSGNSGGTTDIIVGSMG